MGIIIPFTPHSFVTSAPNTSLPHKDAALPKNQFFLSSRPFSPILLSLISSPQTPFSWALFPLSVFLRLSFPRACHFPPHNSRSKALSHPKTPPARTGLAFQKSCIPPKSDSPHSPLNRQRSVHLSQEAIGNSHLSEPDIPSSALSASGNTQTQSLPLPPEPCC